MEDNTWMERTMMAVPTVIAVGHYSHHLAVQPDHHPLGHNGVHQAVPNTRVIEQVIPQTYVYEDHTQHPRGIESIPGTSGNEEVPQGRVFLQDHHQEQLYAADREATFSMSHYDSDLPPPPSYHEAIRSVQSLDSGSLPIPSNADFTSYKSETPVSGPVFSLADLLCAPPSDDGETRRFSTEGLVSFPAEPCPSSSGWPSPPRRRSKSGEVPSCSTTLMNSGCGEYSLYNLDAASSSAAGYQEFSVQPSPITPRPRSTASVLSDLEDNGDISFEANQMKVLEGCSGEEMDGGEGGLETENGGKRGVHTGVEKVGQLGKGQRTILSEEKEKLMQDMMETTTDKEVLACALRVVETNDHSLLTKMMLKTKVELAYISKGEEMPNVSFFPKKQEKHQLRPEEEEKAARRKQNGRLSAKTYRTKLKRLKEEKERLVNELQEKNKDLKDQVLSLKGQISTLRRLAIDQNLLPVTTNTTTTTTTSTMTTSATATATSVPDKAQTFTNAPSSLSLFPSSVSPSSVPDHATGGPFVTPLLLQTHPPR